MLKIEEVQGFQVEIFKHYFEDTGLQRHPFPRKIFAIFVWIINLKPTMFLLVHFSIFGDLDWEGSNGDQKNQLLHFEWSPPWHHTETYLSQILTFFVLKSGEDEKERIILMKSRALRSLDFIRIISPPRPFSWSGVEQWPLWSIWPNWFKLILVMLDSKQFQTPGRLETPRRLGTKIWKI